MVITINCIPFEKENPNQEFIKKFFREVAMIEKEKQFIFLQSAVDHLEITSHNFRIVQIPSTKKATSIAWLSYQKKVSDVVKKFNTGIFLTPYIFSKIFIACPQVLLLPDMATHKFPEYFDKSTVAFANKYMYSGIEKSAGIISSNNGWKHILEETFSYKRKITILNDFLFPDTAEIQKVNNKEGINIPDNPYFMVMDKTITSDTFTFILKAYSAFKKRMKSSMSIVFYIPAELSGSLKEITKNYKFRENVIFLNYEIASTLEIIKGAYAVILNSPYSNFENNFQLFSRSKKTVIINESIFNGSKESFLNNAFYFSGNDIQSLSQQMINCYKDEALKNKIAEEQYHYSLTMHNSLVLKTTIDFFNQI